MRHPEQSDYGDVTRHEMIESNEGISTALQILRETAVKYRSLDEEAQALLHEKGDAAAFKIKLQESARLLVDLPQRLAGNLDSADEKTRERIEAFVEGTATLAQQGLEHGGFMSLGTLLEQQGSRIGEKNDLEQLISTLEDGK